MRYIYIPMFVVLLALSGCSKDAKSVESREERNPLVKQGQAYMEIREYAKAEAEFKRAIENDPTMARPHLDLATIYHQYKINYFHAVYHYDRYLELRPDSEKAEFIREQIRKVQNALSVEVLTKSGAYQLKDERNQLLKENAALKQQLATLQQGTTSTATKQSVTQTVPKNAKPVAAAQTSHQIYTVVAGDNLTKIAKKFYGDGNYEIIYEANKDRMKSPGDLRVGQTLIIPNR